MADNENVEKIRKKIVLHPLDQNGNPNTSVDLFPKTTVANIEGLDEEYVKSSRKVGGLDLTEDTETLGDYVYREKGLKDSKLEAGVKYTITGFFNVNKLNSYLKIFNTSGEDFTVYEDSSIEVILADDKEYVYIEGKLSENPIEYKYYFNGNYWKQIVRNTTTNLNEEVDVTKFSPLSFFYDSSNCSDIHILAILVGLDDVDYEEEKVTLKTQLNNLSELNYGYKETGLKYGARYMLPKYISMATLDTLNINMLQAILNSEEGKVEYPLYEKNGNVRFTESELVNGHSYTLPSSIQSSDLSNLATLLGEYKPIANNQAFPWYDEDGYYYMLLSYLPIPNNWNTSDADLKNIIESDGIIGAIFTMWDALDSDETQTETYQNQIVVSNRDTAIEFTKQDYVSDSSYTTAYSTTDGSTFINECEKIKYDLGMVNKVLSLAEEIIADDTNNELTELRAEYTAWNNLVSKTNELLLAIINSGAVPRTNEALEDYDYILCGELDAAASEGSILSRGVTKGDKVSPIGVSIPSIKYTIKIVSETRNINLLYNISNCCWYDGNGDLVDPSVNQLKFDLTEYDYVDPYLHMILMLNPYNEFEKENIPMNELKNAFYDNEKHFINNYATIQLNDNLDDIRVESHTIEQLTTLLQAAMGNISAPSGVELDGMEVSPKSSGAKGGDAAQLDPGVSVVSGFDPEPTYLSPMVISLLKNSPEIAEKLFVVIYDSGFDSYKDIASNMDSSFNNPYIDYQLNLDLMASGGASELPGLIDSQPALTALSGTSSGSGTRDISAVPSDSALSEIETIEPGIFNIVLFNTEEYAKMAQIMSNGSVDASEYAGCFIIYQTGVNENGMVSTIRYYNNYGWSEDSGSSSGIGEKEFYTAG